MNFHTNVFAVRLLRPAVQPILVGWWGKAISYTSYISGMVRESN